MKSANVPTNVFDTQIAAGFIGLPYPLSLSKLINETVEHHWLGKGLTFTHWDQRPLSASQLQVMRRMTYDISFSPARKSVCG